MEFHVARRARDRYRFDEALFQLTGNVVFADFHAARVFAGKMNEKRDLVRFPERAVRAWQLSAMGLIDEISHLVFRTYRERTNPRMVGDALKWLDERFGAAEVDRMLGVFGDEFPPLEVYRRRVGLTEWQRGASDGVPHRELALEELLMLRLANANPAFGPFLELFDDARPAQETAYPRLLPALRDFFARQPSPAGVLAGATEPNLLDLLQAPALASPHSLEGQLAYILERWGVTIGRSFLYRLLRGLDVIKEETRPIFGAGGGDATAAHVQVPDFQALDAEPEQFTPDREWMPRLVLLARNAFVWLDQLSKRYGRAIDRLDRIPDEELELLARRGFTGLWLIGLWERSAASKRIKQRMGKTDAVASAYSLFDYVVAAELGGDEALGNLRERAWQRGIRLACDMVPNHVGIDGRWVLEHPDWFLQSDRPPYPAYSFHGEDLSSDDRVAIRVEDHYDDRTDAAVVFQRVDKHTGQTRYIYHGNDGTSMPWNDTAQLNYLNPEVREAVIRTILHVAKQFPIIRFDAAMTLAKRHYHRLWFPEPGSGGDIPSRAEHGMTRTQFDGAMPEEFWRNVVDRAAAEAPDTLLLAEAFWLMEGYFVRTLGMHRVYNSAFMVLLRDEDNAKFRQVLKSTLEFDREILRRYVNFLNNPDERTAVDQFGKNDKYFGVCTMMVTLPGLPMFGHGQVEGLCEKYGMEYRRAYWDETPDEHLVARHEREIFPLLHRRRLFAGVEHFLLYDFYSADGTVNEDVMAWSNRDGDERVLVVYHNRFASAAGWVRRSAAYAEKTGRGEERALVQKTLGEGLALRAGPDDFLVFRDHLAGLEYIRPSRRVRDEGLYIELGAYKAHVFVDIREVADAADRRYARLAAYLEGRGVPSIEDAVRDIVLEPIRRRFEAVLEPRLLQTLAPGAAPGTVAEEEVGAARASERERLLELCEGIRSLVSASGDAGAVVDTILRELEVLARLPRAAAGEPAGAGEKRAVADDPRVELANGLAGDPSRGPAAVAWILVHRLGALADPVAWDQESRSWLDEWRVGRVLEATLGALGLSERSAARSSALVKLLAAHQRWHEQRGERRGLRLFEALLADGEAVRLLQINRHQGVLWFNKESFEELGWWLLLAAVVQVEVDAGVAPADAAARLAEAHATYRQGLAAAERSGYQVEKLLAAARGVGG
jgi:glycosidase